MPALIAISLLLITSAYANEIDDKIAQKQAELNKFQELTRAIIINKALDIEEIKQEAKQLKGVKGEESNIAKDAS